MRHEYPVEFVNSLRPPSDGLSELVEPELPCGERLNLQVLLRSVDLENPRVTHYLIDWDTPNEDLVPPPVASEEEVRDDDELVDDEDDEDDDESEDLEGDIDMDDEPTKANANGGQTAEENANASMAHE